MFIPPALLESFVDYVKIIIDTTSAAREMIDELDELIETGFGGREINLIEKLIFRLEELESKTDEQRTLLHSKLHSIEDQFHPVDVVFLCAIIKRIGNLADCAQKTGDQIQIIVTR